MIGTLIVNEKSEIQNKKSTYNPSSEVKDLTLVVSKDYQIGYDIQHRPFREFNDMSFLERMDADQKAFNAYIEAPSDDPDEAWRWNGTRPISRNKILSLAAHFITSTIYPSFFAQNDLDEEDRDMAEMMKYIVQWNIIHSDYELAFLYGVIAALVNPVAYIGVEYLEAFQTIKEKLENGEIKEEEVIDEIFSGMQFPNIPAEEILITNAYQFDIQKQRAIMRERLVDYDEIEAKYGKHKNFKYVKAGITLFYNPTDSSFYEIQEKNNFCKELIYYNRRKDLEVPFVNGVYLGDANVKANLIKHRDNKNQPKYPIVKFGAEPIDERRFYFYKSKAFAMLNDQQTLDRMRQMLIDGTFLEVMTPIGVIGETSIGSDIMFPGSVTNFPKETSVQELGKGRNLAAGWKADEEIERSIIESSQENIRAGLESGGQKTAYEVGKIEQNARINLGIIGKMIIKMVADIGNLMIDNIITHQTVGEVGEMLGGTLKMKYRTFLLPEQQEDGKKVTKKIMFDGNLISKKMTKKEILKNSYKLLEEQGGLDSTKTLYLVNPDKFRKMKYLIVQEPESWMPRNERFETLIKLETYDKLMQNPLIAADRDSIRAVTRDFLLVPIAKSEADKYLPKQLKTGTGLQMPMAASQSAGKESVLAEVLKGASSQNKNLLE